MVASKWLFGNTFFAVIAMRHTNQCLQADDKLITSLSFLLSNNFFELQIEDQLRISFSQN